jgi:hypothetical protein
MLFDYVFILSMFIMFLFIYAERCNAAGLNFMACALETTGAFCKEVTPLIDSINRNIAELSDITFKVAKERIYRCLSFVLQKWNAHSIANEIGRRRLSGRLKEKYPRKKPSDK